MELLSIRRYLLQYLGFDIQDQLTAADWLTFPEKKLRSITAGRIFHDDSGLQEILARFKYYPHDVWLCLLASCWKRIEQDEHLMGRTGAAGDEIGSAIIGSRLVRDCMRLPFLMEQQYTPYAKWFGTAFNRLQSSKYIKPQLQNAAHARSWKEREDNLVAVYEFLACKHNELGVTLTYWKIPNGA